MREPLPARRRTCSRSTLLEPAAPCYQDARTASVRDCLPFRPRGAAAGRTTTRAPMRSRRRRARPRPRSHAIPARRERGACHCSLVEDVNGKQLRIAAAMLLPKSETLVLVWCRRLKQAICMIFKCCYAKPFPITNISKAERGKKGKR